MKNKIIIALVFAISTVACVQKAYLKTIIVTLTISNKKDIKKVGIRGNGKPLSWREDFEMKEIIKDSVYTATVQVMTAYKFGEIKFTVDDEFEFKDQPNRRITFNEKGDTTYYNAKFGINN